MGKCVFSDLWLQKPLYKEWLRKVKGDKHKARCIVYMKDVDILSMGELALTSHLKGKKSTNTDIIGKVISKRFRVFLALSSHSEATNHCGK